MKTTQKVLIVENFQKKKRVKHNSKKFRDETRKKSFQQMIKMMDFYTNQC